MKELWEQVTEQLDPDTNAFRILVYLAFSKDPCRPAEVAEGTGIPAGTTRPVLRSLLKKGFVDQEPDGTYKSKISFAQIIADIFQRLPKK